MKVESNSKESSEISFSLCTSLVQSSFEYDGRVLDGYGVRVEKSDENGNLISHKEFRNITTSKVKCIDFIKLISRNFAQPEILEELVEDFLSD